MMPSHFRTLTCVVEIDDDTDLRYVGYAAEVARKALEGAGFKSAKVRSEHNEAGDIPPGRDEVTW